MKYIYRRTLETAGIVVAALIIFFFINRCSETKNGEGRILVSSDTTEYVQRIDSLEKVIKAKASFVDPTEIDSKTLDPEVITKYIQTTEECDRPHLSSAGVNLIKIRKYSDYKVSDSFKISYNATVLGELKNIDFSLEGKYYQREIHTVRTVENNYIKQTHQIYLFANYNRSLKFGVAFQNNKFHYGLNYDLDNNTLGGTVGYTVFNF